MLISSTIFWFRHPTDVISHLTIRILYPYVSIMICVLSLYPRKSFFILIIPYSFRIIVDDSPLSYSRRMSIEGERFSKKLASDYDMLIFSISAVSLQYLRWASCPYTISAIWAGVQGQNWPVPGTDRSRPPSLAIEGGPGMCKPSVPGGKPIICIFVDLVDF